VAVKFEPQGRKERKGKDKFTPVCSCTVQLSLLISKPYLYLISNKKTTLVASDAFTTLTLLPNVTVLTFCHYLR
jgi:hypothetical protein